MEQDIEAYRAMVDTVKPYIADTVYQINEWWVLHSLHLL